MIFFFYRPLESFANFSADGTQKLKGHPMYMKQLMQIPGVSFQVAKSICSAYPSFTELIQNYNSPFRSDEEKRRLLEDVTRIDNNRKLGIAVSTKVYLTFCSSDPKTLINE